MILDSEFQLVHGARYWGMARVIARDQGADICEEPPAVCVAVLWMDPGWKSWRYVASVGAIETTAQLVIYEWTVVDSNIPQRIRTRAVEHLMRAGMVYATACNKRIMTLNTSSGIRAIARRVGFGVVNKGLEVIEGDLP